MNQPAKIFHEVNDKGRKRKKKGGKFSSLVKKACKRLEDEDDDQTTIKLKKLLRNKAWEVTENVTTSAKMKTPQGWTVTSVSYDAEFSQSEEPSSVPITVPRSACEDRPNILASHENYAIVDFKDFDHDARPTENTEQVEMIHYLSFKLHLSK
jgi:hypothetical protein